jgi:hypothetical protein
MVLWQDSTEVWNRQVPEAGIRKFRAQPLDYYFEEQAKRELLNSKRDDLLFYLVPADGKICWRGRCTLYIWVDGVIRL